MQPREACRGSRKVYAYGRVALDLAARALLVAGARPAAATEPASRPSPGAAGAGRQESGHRDGRRSITGKVDVRRHAAAERRSSRWGRIPACGAADGRAPSRSSSTTAALQNVFVYIKDGLGNKYLFDTPTEPVKLDQKGCHYSPHVLGVRAAQPLEVINSDNTLHNVHAHAGDEPRVQPGAAGAGDEEHRRRSPRRKC